MHLLTLASVAPRWSGCWSSWSCVSCPVPPPIVFISVISAGSRAIGRLWSRRHSAISDCTHPLASVRSQSHQRGSWCSLDSPGTHMPGCTNPLSVSASTVALGCCVHEQQFRVCPQLLPKSTVFGEVSSGGVAMEEVCVDWGSIFGPTRDFKFQNDQEASDLFINALKTRHNKDLRPL